MITVNSVKEIRKQKKQNIVDDGIDRDSQIQLGEKGIPRFFGMQKCPMKSRPNSK